MLETLETPAITEGEGDFREGSLLLEVEVVEVSEFGGHANMVLSDRSADGPKPPGSPCQNCSSHTCKNDI